MVSNTSAGHFESQPVVEALKSTKELRIEDYLIMRTLNPKSNTLIFSLCWM
jgi:hypothetical protein